MSLIYIISPDGQQEGHAEPEIQDMLAREVITAETLFWREGMDEWRPLSEMIPQPVQSVAPPRRKEALDPKSGAKRPPAPQPSPSDGASESSSLSRDVGPYLKRKAYGRYYFRRNPVALTVMLQVLMVGSIAATGFFIYQCLDKIYNWSSPYTADPMLGKILGREAALAGVSAGATAEEMAGFFHFFWVLVGLQVAVEILFYIWIYYANKNSRGFANNMLYTSGWAVGFFFIPLVNFFRPYQVMQEIWKISVDPRGWMGRRDSIYVGFWFLVRWLVVLVLVRGQFHTSFSDSDNPSVQALGTLAYLATVEGAVVLVEVTGLILISLVVWRQVGWVKGKKR